MEVKKYQAVTDGDVTERVARDEGATDLRKTALVKIYNNTTNSGAADKCDQDRDAKEGGATEGESTEVGATQIFAIHGNIPSLGATYEVQQIEVQQLEVHQIKVQLVEVQRIEVKQAKLPGSQPVSA